MSTIIEMSNISNDKVVLWIWLVLKFNYRVEEWLTFDEHGA